MEENLRSDRIRGRKTMLAAAGLILVLLAAAVLVPVCRRAAEADRRNLCQHDRIILCIRFNEALEAEKDLDPEDTGRIMDILAQVCRNELGQDMTETTTPEDEAKGIRTGKVEGFCRSGGTVNLELNMDDLALNAACDAPNH